QIEFVNKLQEPVELVGTKSGEGEVTTTLANIAPNGSFSYTCEKGWAGNFRCGHAAEANLFEMSVMTENEWIHYDLDNEKGFNVPMKVQAPDGKDAPDAYQTPDDHAGKQHSSAAGKFVVTFEN
ncbi:unnamed protein product, partial [Didymodactylos carnosus]